MPIERPAEVSTAFRSTAFDDGIVVLDPVTVYLVTLAPFAEEILDFLREQIESGVQARLPLLHSLQAEIELNDYESKPESLIFDQAALSLLDWVDLALHLYT